MINLKEDTNDFKGTILDCIIQVGISDPDYKSCINDLMSTINLNDLECCVARMSNFKCFRKLLVTKCGVSNEQVEQNDDTHFNYWNNLKIPYFHGKCDGEKQESLKYCKIVDEFNDVNNDKSLLKKLLGKAKNENSIDKLNDWPPISTTTSVPKTTKAPKLIQLLFGEIEQYQLTAKELNQNKL